MLKKILQANQKDWDHTLKSDMWDFWTSYALTIGMTPFKLVYGCEVAVLMEFIVPNLRIAIAH